MKEVTYEDWQKNPMPRVMWVWDNIEKAKEQRKVVYFLSPGISFPVVALTENMRSTEHFKHCAEIEEPKTRRMTHKELARWLREKPTREFKYNAGFSVYSVHAYDEDCGNKDCDDIVIREDDGEWREPLVEE